MKSPSPPAAAPLARANASARPSSVPPALWQALYPFQREGVEFGLNVDGRVLIGDEMGLGKTLQVHSSNQSYDGTL